MTEPTNAEIRKQHDKTTTNVSNSGARRGFYAAHKHRGILLDRLDEAQFKIDMLMLEYCPEDMTDSQRKAYAENQTNDLPTEGNEMKTIEHIIKELRCLETDLREIVSSEDMNWQADRVKHVIRDLEEIEGSPKDGIRTNIHASGTGNN